MDEPPDYHKAHRDAVEWARKLSPRRLREEIMRGSPGIQIGILEKELALRGAAKHWSIGAGFFIGCLTTLFAAIAAWPIVHGWIGQRSAQSAPAPALQTKEIPTPAAPPTIATSPPPYPDSFSPVATPKPEQQP